VRLRRQAGTWLRFTTRERPRLALFKAVPLVLVMEKDKSKRPWGGFGYLILVVLAVLVAWFIVLPIGQQIAGVFQTLTNAFQGKH